MEVQMDATVISNLQNRTHLHAHFRVSMKPIKDRVFVATVYDARIAHEPSLAGSSMAYETQRKLTAVKFSNVNQATEYVNKALTVPQEFKGLLIFQVKNGEETFLLGDFIGWTVDAWLQDGGTLWELDINRDRQATQTLKRTSENLAKLLFKRHDNNKYVGNLSDSVYINPLTCTITTLTLSNLNRDVDDGILDDLNDLVIFMNDCNANVPGYMKQTRSVDIDMFNQLYRFILNSPDLDVKDKSYVICHAPLFWHTKQRYNFANKLWEIGKERKCFLSVLKLDTPPTDVVGWRKKLTGILQKCYDSNRDGEIGIIAFFRNVFSHFDEKALKETLEEVDSIILRTFPDAYSKAYMELFTRWLAYDPNIIQELKFGDYPLLW